MYTYAYYIYISDPSLLTTTKHRLPSTTLAPHKNGSQGNTQTMVLLCPKLDCRAEWKAFKMASGVDKGEHLRFSASWLVKGRGPTIRVEAASGKFQWEFNTC